MYAPPGPLQPNHCRRSAQAEYPNGALNATAGLMNTLWIAWPNAKLSRLSTTRLSQTTSAETTTPPTIDSGTRTDRDIDLTRRSSATAGGSELSSGFWC